MSRLVEAKVELAEACERRDAAELEFRAASNRGSVGDLLTAARKVKYERRVVSKLLDEVQELESRGSAIAQDFGPGADEAIS